MRIPNCIRKYLPMWTHICPKCRREVKRNSHECPYCGEKYPLTLRVPFSGLQDREKLETYVHKHIFPRISAWERHYLTQFFTVLFSDSFASGNFSAWSGTSGTCSVVTSPTYPKQTYAAELNPSSGTSYVYKTLAASHATLYMLAYVNFGSLPPNSGASPVIYLADSSWTYYVELEIGKTSGGATFWMLQTYGSLQAYYDVTISTNTWYCVELMFTAGAPGVGTFWINGTQQGTITTVTLSANAQVAVIYSKYIQYFRSVHN